MAVLRTRTCHRHGHPEFRISYDPDLVLVESDLQWLIGWLEDSVAEGSRFIPGQTCQVGWGITKVRQSDDDSVSLWEPDMHAMPIQWVESVSNTMRMLRLQKDVVESVLSPSDLEFPSMLESCLICTRLSIKNGLVMERTEPNGSDSGWFAGCVGQGHDHNDPEELRCVSLYEAGACYSSQIIPYLALPAGVFLYEKNGIPRISINDEELSLKPGSLLAARHSQKRQ